MPADCETFFGITPVSNTVSKSRRFLKNKPVRQQSSNKLRVQSLWPPILSPSKFLPVNQLDFPQNAEKIPRMALPTEPVTLSVEQIEELNRKLSTMRHDVNNHLMLIMTAVELFRLKPESSERMLTMLVEQPQKIAANITKFSGELESALRITRP